MSYQTSLITALASATLLSASASADSWSDKIVVTKEVDFGVIATGSEAIKYVKLKNVYNQPVHISDVRTTCGCSAAAIGERTIQPGETAEVEIKMNTANFRHRKDPTLIITFDSPRLSEARVPIHAYIRTDVVFNPGIVRFGNVDMGREKSVTVSIAYAGRDDWDIVNVKINNTSLKGRLQLKNRSAGRVDYELNVTLKESAPPGRVRDLIQIVTNDRSNPYVPLMVDGYVTPDITATPSPLKLPPVAAGQSTTARLLLKGKKPFQVEKIACKAMSDSFTAMPSSKAATVHVLPIKFNAPTSPGRFKEELEVTITGRSQPLKVLVTGTITE